MIASTYIFLDVQVNVHHIERTLVSFASKLHVFDDYLNARVVVGSAFDTIIEVVDQIRIWLSIPRPTKFLCLLHKCRRPRSMKARFALRKTACRPGYL